MGKLQFLGVAISGLPSVLQNMPWTFITGIVETVKMVGIGRNSRNFIK